MINWTYKSEKDYEDSIFKIEGDYPATVVSAVEKINSKDGNDMLELKFEVEYPLGGKGVYYFWLHNTKAGYLSRKKFWESAGAIDKLNAPCHEYMGKKVNVRLKVQKDPNKGLRITDFCALDNDEFDDFPF